MRRRLLNEGARIVKRIMNMVVHIRDARIVLGGVAPTPLRAEEAEHIIKGKLLDAKTAEKAAKASVSGARALSGNAYKVEITKTLVKRALLL